MTRTKARPRVLLGATNAGLRVVPPALVEAVTFRLVPATISVTVTGEPFLHGELEPVIVGGLDDPVARVLHRDVLRARPSVREDRGLVGNALHVGVDRIQA